MKTLAELEAEVARLNIAIAELKSGKAPPVTPPQEQRGVRISIVEDASPIEMPSDAELSGLMEIVHSKYPALRPVDRTDIGHADFFDGLNAAFTRISYLKRTPMPDTKHYISWHVDEAIEWLRLHCPDFRGNVPGAYLTAIVAAGDIVFVPGNPAAGVVWAIGISPHTGTPATPAWQKVLRGELLAPTAARRYA